MRHLTIAVLTLIAFALLVLPASAQTGPPEAVADLNDASHQVAQARNRDFVVLPIPVANPAIGNGLAVAAMALYTPDGATEPWTTGVGGAYTDTESWFVGAFQRANFRNDRFRLTAGIGYGDANLDFYGIGPEAGDRDRSIAIEQKGALALVEASARVAPNFYIGPAFRYLDISTSLNLEDIDFPDQDIPASELESHSVALGVAAEYDTRDSQYGAPARSLFDGAGLPRRRRLRQRLRLYARRVHAERLLSAVGQNGRGRPSVAVRRGG